MPSELLARLRRAAEAFEAEAEAARLALVSSQQTACCPSCSVTVDARGRVVAIAFTSRIRALTATRLAGDVLQAYVSAAVEVSRGVAAHLGPTGAAALAAMAELEVHDELDAEPAGRSGEAAELSLEISDMPSAVELAHVEHEMRLRMDSLAIAARETADDLERITTTRRTPRVSVTVSGSGRLRRISFAPAAVRADPEDLAREVMSLVDQTGTSPLHTWTGVLS